MRDYYEIFGVTPDATPEEIKERYRFLAHAYHPDKFSSEQHRQRAEQQFKEVNEAYETLKDSLRRRSYDSTRTNNNPPPHSTPPLTRTPPPPSTPQRRPAFAWLIAAAIVIACVVFIGPFHRPQPLPEFFAWEKTQLGQYKQVRKNYFMDEVICKNVIDVLNAMSTTQPPSNYILSHTTDSTFESWPSNSPPSPRLQEFSTYSDEPNTHVAQ